MPDVPAPSRLAVRTPSVGRPRHRVHPCIARPDLYPVEGPRVVASPVHDFALKLLWEFLTQHLAGTPHAPHYCLAGDVYLHASGGGRRVAPDVILYLLAPRVPPSGVSSAAVPDEPPVTGPRRGRGLSFAVEHDGPPDLVLELLSVGTWEKDAGVGDGLDDKQRFYAECGVREYWLYDPEGYRTDGGPVLQGFRLHAQSYREIAPVTEDALWWSDVLQTHWGLTPGGTASRASTPSYACATRRPGPGMPRNINVSGSAGRIRRGWPRRMRRLPISNDNWALTRPVTTIAQKRNPPMPLYV